MNIFDEINEIVRGMWEPTERFFIAMQNQVEFFKDKEDGWKPYLKDSRCALCGEAYVESNVIFYVSGGEPGEADCFVDHVCDVCATATSEVLRERIEWHIRMREMDITFLKMALDRGVDTLDEDAALVGKYGALHDDRSLFRTEDVRQALCGLQWNLEWKQVPEKIKFFWKFTYGALMQEWMNRCK